MTGLRSVGSLGCPLQGFGLASTFAVLQIAAFEDYLVGSGTRS